MSLDQTSSIPARRRSQAERRDESERQLVEATLKVVAGQGVSAATFEEIGRAAGVSRGLATQRFGSKRGLTEAVIAWLHRRREAVIEAEGIDRLPATEAIAHYVESLLDNLEREEGGRAYFMLLAAAVADTSPLLELFAASHERVRVWLRRTLQRGQESGEIRAGLDADTAALMIGSLLLGLGIQRLVDPSADMAKVRRTTLESLNRALLAEAQDDGEGSP